MVVRSSSQGRQTEDHQQYNYCGTRQKHKAFMDWPTSSSWCNLPSWSWSSTCCIPCWTYRATLRSTICNCWAFHRTVFRCRTKNSITRWNNFYWHKETWVSGLF
jgi:hypothetical protein